MNYLSKEAPLDTSINKMETILKELNCNTVFSDLKNPMPNCYSVNLAYKDAAEYVYSNGKGVCEKSCKASALGEFIERLQSNNFFIDFYLPNRKHYPDEVLLNENNYLSPKLEAIYNPNSELSFEDFIDFNSDYYDKVVALPFVNAITFQVENFPINVLQNLYVSNGLAAGNSKLEARVQALSEIVERYVKFEVIKNGYALPEFPAKVVEKFEVVSSGVAKLQDEGYEVLALDASLGGKYPVVAIALINRADGSLFVSFGAHPILQVALERTLTELMQGRDLNSLTGFEVPTFDREQVASSFNLESHFIDSNGKMGLQFLSSIKSFEYCEFAYKGSGVEDEYNYLLNILTAQKKDVYIRDYDYLGFYTCQIVVPNFSEVYAIDELLYENKNRAKFLRDMVLNFKDYEAEEVLQECEHLDDSIDVAKYIGVVFKNGFSMLEFKAQQYLRNGDLDMATSLLEYSDKKEHLVICELIKMQNEGLEFDNFKDALHMLFGQDLVNRAKSILELKDDLVDLELDEKYYNILKLYDLLESKKCQKS